MDEVLNMSKEIDYGNFFYNFKGSTASINFTVFDGPMYAYNELKNGEKTLQQVEEKQKDFEKDLNEINSGNPKDKIEKQLYTIKNVKNLYNLRQKIIDLLNDYSKQDLEPYTKQNKIKQKEEDLKQ